MILTTRRTPVGSPAPSVIPDTVTRLVRNGSAIARDQDATPARPADARTRETRRERSRRTARRSRLYGYAILTVALVAFLVALATSNTAHVRVNWVVGSSHVSLIWLVLFAAILGWLLGLVATATFHRRTRAPRRGGGNS